MSVRALSVFWLLRFVCVHRLAKSRRQLRSWNKYHRATTRSELNSALHTRDSELNRLRAKVEPDPANPELIATVWGVGYRMDARPTPPPTTRRPDNVTPIRR